MSTNVVARLVMKDVYLCRGIIIASIGAGLLAIGIALLGPIGFAVGGIAFMTSLVAGGIFYAMFLIITERKERSILFALSLPVSVTQYQRAKLLAVLAGYFIPWSVLTVAAMVYVNLPGVPGGLIPYVLTILVFFITLQSVTVAFLFCVTSEHIAGLGIVAINLCISFFMMYINIMSSIGRHTRDRVATWSPDVFTLIGVELGVAALALAFAFYMQSRPRDIL